MAQTNGAANGTVRITVPAGAKQILDTLAAAGYEAYAVGGCVRDSILGREPQDWDITTSALPEQVKALFRRTIDTGIQHGTVTVMLGKEGYEVTTYRIDGKYEDGRHPKQVTFTPSLEEDLKRRDFTINAMAYNETMGLVDLYGGMEDLKNGTIRCVGDPRERFSEDALRILRAIRFSAQLGYEIEPETRRAVAELAPTLERISAERIQTELVKLLISPHPDYLRLAYDTGVTKMILPEFDACMETPQHHPHHCYNVGEHTLHTLTAIPPDRVLRLAMLLHDIGKPATLMRDADGTTHFHGHNVAGEKLARAILRRLKFDNDTIDVVCRLVLYHDYGNGIDPDMRIVRRAMNRVGEDAFPLIFPVKYADICGQSEYKRAEKLHNLALWREYYDKVRAQEQCVSLRTLAVNGRDLIAAGMEPGPRIGETLHRLLDDVIENPEHNEKEYLLTQI